MIWQMLTICSVDEDQPPTGHWSEDGCYLLEQEGEAVVCKCNHLTHFAILLSPGVEVRITHTWCKGVWTILTELYVYVGICFWTEDTDLHWLCNNPNFSNGPPPHNVHLHFLSVLHIQHLWLYTYLAIMLLIDPSGRFETLSTSCSVPTCFWLSYYLQWE